MAVLNLRYSRRLWLFLTIALFVFQHEYGWGGSPMEITSDCI